MPAAVNSTSKGDSVYKEQMNLCSSRLLPAIAVFDARKYSLDCLSQFCGVFLKLSLTQVMQTSKLASITCVPKISTSRSVLVLLHADLGCSICWDVLNGTEHCVIISKHPHSCLRNSCDDVKGLKGPKMDNHFMFCNLMGWNCSNLTKYRCFPAYKLLSSGQLQVRGNLRQAGRIAGICRAEGIFCQGLLIAAHFPTNTSMLFPLSSCSL